MPLRMALMQAASGCVIAIIEDCLGDSDTNERGAVLLIPLAAADLRSPTPLLFLERAVRHKQHFREHFGLQRRREEGKSCANDKNSSHQQKLLLDSS